MRRYTTILLLASALAAAVVAAPLLYAEESPSGSMMGRGMMGADRGGGMMGMMNMMPQMSQMMDHCNNMMSSSRPNDQWRKKAPSEPEKKG
jgi:Spy/CpxP family protein refolding chaperone